MRKRLVGWLCDAALILYFVFALFPIAWMVILSLKPTDQLFSTYFSFSPTLDGYRTVLGDSEGIPFVRFFVNSLVVSVGAVALSLVVGLPAAYASARWRFKGSENLMFTLLSFRFAPELTVIIPLFVLYQKLGLFDTYVGMVWVLQLVTLPLIVWIMRSYFADLTPELEQAALLDGYTRKQAFFRVALPLVKPGIAAVSLLAFIFAWNNFVFPLILTSNEAQTVTVGALSFLGGDRPKYNLTAAAALVSVVPPLLLALTIQRYLVRGLSFGAVKS
ncbi:carbohydrate ABC transporter permease [Streptomyces purpurascens]|uniref:Carbohydrate ABC transporter permease n=1 Tax=Streptomyces purpurascens TaxID=1924 RepID=A0ABZ1MI69_STREF|nr:carbohydrate ABC transporter permease [Streptomyces purpurascens]MCE7045130.1 carbohydrate ABC transporter permease [Streptomyces purpurascens]GHA12523.1 ABC transporter permease [Streptomyces purpurascens]